MSMWTAQEQANALTKVAVPTCFFGLLIFLKALVAPFNEPASSVLAWCLALPIFMAFYLYLKGEVPNSTSPFIDDYVEKTMMLAKSRAGFISLMFLLASLLVKNDNPPWSYESAVDMTFGVYMMAMGSIGWWEMREEPEPELESEFESEPKSTEQSKNG